MRQEVHDFVRLRLDPSLQLVILDRADRMRGPTRMNVYLDTSVDKLQEAKDRSVNRIKRKVAHTCEMKLK
jgi:hypothetical protein